LGARQELASARQEGINALLSRPGGAYNRPMDGDRNRRGGEATPTPTLLGWLFALGAPIVVSLAIVPFRSDIRTTNVALVLVVIVVAAAALGGRIGGVVAALASMAAFDFFFTRPYYSFTINSRDDIETAVLLLIVGLAVGELVVRTRRSREQAVTSRAEVVRVRRLSELAAGGEPTGRLIGIVQGELVSLLQLRGCHFERPPFPSEIPELGHQGVRNAAGSDVPTEELGSVALPVYGAGRLVARFVLVLPSGTTGIMLPPEDRALAFALADQLGTVLASAIET
jgi:Domain of unknown function (DUF4118)